MFLAVVSSVLRVSSFREAVDTGYRDFSYLAALDGVMFEEARCRARFG